MSSVVKIKILETVDELRELLRSSETKEVRERVQALYWLKRVVLQKGEIKVKK